MKQKWSHLDPMVDLLDKIEEVVDLVETENTPIPGGGWSILPTYLSLELVEWKNHVSSGKICRFSKITDRYSRITLRKHTGATISAKKQQPLPVYMVLQKTMRMK